MSALSERCAGVVILSLVVTSGVPRAQPGLQTYHSEPFGFSIDYPAAFVLLGEPPAPPQRRPPPLHRVRFQERHLANSAVAELEPPKLTIEVFEAKGLPLREWLETSGRLRPGSATEPFMVAGARESIRVREMRQLAPNEFYYVLNDRFVFALTPIGADAMEMLRTFRLAVR